MDKYYWYLSPTANVFVGNEVFAPLGRHNGLQIAVVTEKTELPPEQAPIPLDQIKSIVCVRGDGLESDIFDFLSDYYESISFDEYDPFDEDAFGDFFCPEATIKQLTKKGYSTKSVEEYKKSIISSLPLVSEYRANVSSFSVLENGIITVLCKVNVHFFKNDAEYNKTRIDCINIICNDEYKILTICM